MAAVVLWRPHGGGGGCGTVVDTVLWRLWYRGGHSAVEHQFLGEDSKTETTGLFTRVGMSGPRASTSGLSPSCLEKSGEGRLH